MAGKATLYTAINCAGCGAPLVPPTSGSRVECSYCGRVLVVEANKTRQMDAAVARDLTDELLRGYAGRDVGSGRRIPAPQIAKADWRCWEHGVWPTAARASSTFGAGWRPSAVVGAPRVFPRCGDIPGAWAPGTRNSHVEWIEADFATDMPPIRAVRVFETCAPGASFAVTLRDGSAEELAWMAEPRLQGKTANVLEIELDPPRPVHGVRVYVSNDIGSRWSEIDSICLVATEPIPVPARRKPPLFRAMTVLWLVLLAMGGMGLYFGVQSCREGVTGVEAPAMPAVPSQQITGATMQVWKVQRAGMRRAGTVWANRVLAYSSQYGDSGWSAQQVLGAPNTFPTHGDHSTAWAARGTNSGGEYISLRFPAVANASSVIIVETFNPGAVVRVDDLSNPDAPVVLWQGQTQPLADSRVLSLELPEPRTISALRIVLDTGLVNGWNELDAVGLLPARPDRSKPSVAP